VAPGGVEPPPTDSKSVALSTELRGLPGSMPATRARASRWLRGALGFARVSYVRDEHANDVWIELDAREAHELVQGVVL
jgi:hypothetical protein